MNDKARTVFVSFRVTADEREHIRRDAGDESVSDYIRRKVIGESKTVPTADDVAHAFESPCGKDDCIWSGEIGCAWCNAWENRKKGDD